MTTNSPDLFLEEVHLVVIFLKDGFISLRSIDCKGKIYESGTILQLCREEELGVETCVVLGMSGKFSPVMLWKGPEISSK